MPWKETCPMNERMEFIGLYRRDEWSMAELCREFGISRKTGYKWVERYRRHGVAGLVDYPRAPRRHPNAVPVEIEKKIVAFRRIHHHWGPDKLRTRLRRLHPRTYWPAVSTFGEILKRHGLVVPRRRRRRTPPYTDPFQGSKQPNDVWCADFKGWFRTGDGSRCDPFTLTDSYSRYLLRCQAVLRPDYAHVKPLIDAAFREYGLPRAIRTDNGPPFATRTLAGLSRLAMEWIKLGIVPERIAPGKPSQNGRHERMHRTLKEATAAPPRRSLRAQQKAVDHFRDEYNGERPHQALNNQIPADVFYPSPRRYPLRVPKITYPQGTVTRHIRAQGEFRWHSRQVFLSETLAGEDVAFFPIAGHQWQIRWGEMKLAIYDEKNGRVIRPTPPPKTRKR